MDEPVSFSLSYAQLTAVTEQYIRNCIQNAVSGSEREAGIELDWARATLDHWYLLVRVGNAPDAVVDADRLRMTDLIWRFPAEEERACRQ